MKRILFRFLVLQLIIFALNYKTVYSQSFYNTYGNGANIETGTVIAVDNDHCIYIGGSEGLNCYISKLDSSGTIVIWTKLISINTQYYNRLNNISITSDNYLIGTVDISCFTIEFCGTGYFKMDLNGNIKWIRNTISPFNNYSFRKIFQLNSSTYIISGIRNSHPGNSHSDWKFLKVNSSNGDIQFQSGLIDEEHDSLNNYVDDIYSSTEITNNHFYFTGRIYAAGAYTKNMRPNIVKMDTNFNVVWSNFYYKNSIETARIYPFGIAEYNDTIIVLYNGDKNGVGPAYSCGLIKIKGNGDVIWQKDYNIPISTNDHAGGIVVVADGYLIYGGTDLASNGALDFFVIKTDRNGNVLWSKLSGGPNTSEWCNYDATGVSILKNNYLYFIGQTNDAFRKIAVVKMDMNGGVDCIVQNQCNIVTTVIPNYQKENQHRTELADTVLIGSGYSSTGILNSLCGTFSLGRDSIFCSKISYLLQAPIIANAQYLWNTGDTTNSISIQDTGYYSVKVSANCCFFWDTIRISKAPINILYQQFTLCQGDSLKVGSHYYINAGVYLDSLIAVDGCDSLVITILDFYPTYFNFSQSLCDGDSLFFDGTYIKTGGIYYGNFHSILGCDSLVQLIILIQPLPILILTGDSLLCEGDSTQLIVSGALSYNWWPTMGLSSSNQDIVNASPTTTTTYFVAGSVGNCIDTIDITIKVNEKPQSGFSYALESCELKVFFSADNSTGNTCLWNFGDGFIGEICTITHTYSSEGVYSVTLKEENTIGCQSDTSYRIEVNKLVGNSSLPIPSYFSPNDDGLNDIYYFGNYNECAFVSYEIFNTLGQLIFKSNEVEIGWDGRNSNGFYCYFGTYFYHLVSKQNSYSGKIVLIR